MVPFNAGRHRRYRWFPTCHAVFLGFRTRLARPKSACLPVALVLDMPVSKRRQQLILPFVTYPGNCRIAVTEQRGVWKNESSYFRKLQR